MYSQGSDVWSVPSEDKAKHEKLFQTLHPTNGKISGDQAKKCFMKSNLPSPILGQIWSLSDLDKDGRMTLQEFIIAMHLIQSKLKGVEVPRILPSTLRSSAAEPSAQVFPQASSSFNQSQMQPMPPMSSSMMMNGSSMGMTPPMVPMMTPMMGPPMIGPMGFSSSVAQNNPQLSMSMTPQGQYSGTGFNSQGKMGTIPGAMYTSNVKGFSSTLPPNKPSTSSAFDSLAFDSLQGFANTGKSATMPKGDTKMFGSISATDRLRYTQIFRASDSQGTGFLQGDQAQKLLIQSNVSPQLLAQIWDLADMNKDGRLDLDEFIVAMHLIDSSKQGVAIPSQLPQDLIPLHLRSPTGSFKSDLVRSDNASRKTSASGDVFNNSASFEDRRKMNWDKGQQELERRRRELQEKQQREKEERERKEREEEERKRRQREEAEQKRLQELETQRRQKEELEREQEALRKKMIEERLQAQIEAEKRRQREWEERRKEELLNQKGLEENIVNELKNRLTKLKAELESQTSSRDLLKKTFESKKQEGRELRLAIETLKASHSKQLRNIARLELELKNSKSRLTELIEEREQYLLELNKKDSTTTSEAIGGIRSSIQQMTLGIQRLRKTVLGIESETANVLRDATNVSQKHRELKTLFEDCLRKNNDLKHESDMKKRELLDAKKNAEFNERRVAAQHEKQEEIRKKLEEDLRRQQENEQEAMRKEQEIQKLNQRIDSGIAQRRDLIKQQAHEALQKNLFQAFPPKNDARKEEDTSKVPPPRPRTRPQTSPVKPPLQFNTDLFEAVSKRNDDKIMSNPSSQNTANNFASDFSAFDDVSKTSSKSKSIFDMNFVPATQGKTPPARPTPPRPAPPKIKQSVDESTTEKLPAEQRKKEKENEKKKKEDEKKRKKEEEAKKKAEEMERKRLEKEKQEIDRLKKEQEQRDKELAIKLQKEGDRRKKEEFAKQEAERARQAEQERQKQEALERERSEKEKNEEKLRKEAEVKRKVEEMQRKKMEKKNVTLAKTEQQGKVKSNLATATAPIQQYTKKVAYKMMFPFEARNPDELTVNEGNIVMVDESGQSDSPAGWFKGTFNGNTGLFPANYASKLQTDNFSDYVDLDPRADVQQADSYSQSNTQPLENKVEAIPKLKPVPRKTSANTAKGTQPKTALLPGNSLKPIQASSNSAEQPQNFSEQPRKKVMQQRASASYEKSSDLFPRYDYVTSPPVLDPTVGFSDDEIYSIPSKKVSKSTENLFSYKEDKSEDIYQVPSPTNVSSESFYVSALYPYRGKKDDHLSFDKNDQILVQQKQDQWWYGECKGLSGWFPKSYVKTLAGPGASALSISNENLTDISQELPQPEEYEECIAMFEYVVGQDGDLMFYEGDIIKIISKEGDWWEGECKGKRGLFPANYVQILEKTPSQPENTIEKLSKPEVAIVTTKYTKGGMNEINLNVGQLVHIFQKDPNGWWEGELQVRGKNKPRGWFPSANVKLKVKTEPPSMSKQVESNVAMETQEDIYSVPVKRKGEMQNKVLALFPYTAQNDDELTFYKGSVITVLSKDGEWWKGELNNQVGVFPFNYVQDLRSDNTETSQWSGAFDINVLKSMTRTEQQRQNHIYELINTEQDYMNDLSLTLEVFYNPMAEGKMLTEQELHTVFVNWKELIMCNMKFLKALLVRKKMSETDKIEGIGDILIEQLPRFSPYTRFCSCLVNACRFLQDKVEKDPNFKAFEKQCAGDPRLKQNLPLSSYLLKPLQRITKYPLIISGILKYTPEDYFDRVHLEAALEKAEDLCSQVNEGVGSQENANKLEWLQERVNLDGLEEVLVFNSQTNCVGHRKFLFHGTLHKHKSNKELKAFLFNDFLMLCRVQMGHFKSSSNFPVFHPDNNTQYTLYKKPIFLNEVIVKNPTDPEANDVLFHLSHIDRVHSFRADSKNERNNWVSAIQHASQAFIETERERRNRASRARSLGDFEVARLVVTIIEGADLHPCDPNGTSDPYCEVSMGSQEQKTKVIPKDLNPKWNSTMVFNVKDVDKDVLCITVFDRDFFSPNDFLGRTEISVSSIAREGYKPITKRLLLHEVSTGEIVVTLELQNVK